MQKAKIHSKGGRLFLIPSEILSSEKGKEIIRNCKQSNFYKKIRGMK